MSSPLAIHFEPATDADPEEAIVGVFEMLLRASYESCGQAYLTGSPTESEHEQIDK